ncbi:transposase [Candidatus Erwinia dacicola]|uniref:transposase n=1 Tax=Candidatus Erwinia dacicola TaxID=252393 RepID=UPI00139222AC|nr:transposase [Candidatus Erwinia dacicola]NJD85339.1 transposase [Candidatus Erwinia dacicola]
MAKHFTAEFKLEAAKLVVDHGYIFVKAAEAVNFSHSALTRWVNKLRLEDKVNPLRGFPSPLSSLSCVRWKKIQRLEMENEILKRLRRS